MQQKPRYRQPNQEPYPKQQQRAADLRGVNLSGADLRDMPLQYANMSDAGLVSTNLSGANLSGANLQNSVLPFSNLTGAQLQGVNANHAQFHQACLQEILLSSANLSHADLSQADLQQAILQLVDFRHASLYLAKLSSANLRWANLCGATLDGVRMNDETILANIKLDSETQLGDISWNNASLTQINWEQVTCIGDEVHAKTQIKELPNQGIKERSKSVEERMHEYQQTSRTYRSLALALREQGLSRRAIYFNTRAERMDCYVLFYRARTYSSWRHINLLLFAYLSWFGSCILYGFTWLSAHLGWLFLSYLLGVFCFTIAYFVVGLQAHTGLTLIDAFVLSLTSFHGRGLQPSTDLNDAMRVIAGIEAIFGLLIEALFISAFTRRVTGS